MYPLNDLFAFLVCIGFVAYQIVSLKNEKPETGPINAKPKQERLKEIQTLTSP
jgi:hypothetical protein